MLDRHAELTQLPDALAVNLIDSDEDAAPLAQNVGQQGQLGPEPSAGSVPLGDLPVGAKATREGDTGQMRRGLPRVNVGQEAGQLLMNNAVNQVRRRGLGDHQPASTPATSS